MLLSLTRWYTLHRWKQLEFRWNTQLMSDTHFPNGCTIWHLTYTNMLLSTYWSNQHNNNGWVLLLLINKYFNFLSQVYPSETFLLPSITHQHLKLKWKEQMLHDWKKVLKFCTLKCTFIPSHKPY
jgi:hypothetical protein